MIDTYLNREVVIIRGAPTDQWQQSIGAPRRVRTQAYFRPASKVFPGSAGQEVMASGVCTFAPGTQIGYTDRIVVDGTEYRPVEIRRVPSLDGEELIRVYVA